MKQYVFCLNIADSFANVNCWLTAIGGT